MRLYPPMYPGDSILQPGTFPGGDIMSVWDAAVFRKSFVRSNIRAENALEAGVDFAAIERQARAARSAWVGSKLKSFYEALVRKFERAGEPERENYLAASQALAELEERIRRYERMQSRDYPDCAIAVPPLRTHYEDLEMKATTDKAAYGSSIDTRLDTIRMSEQERRHAYASLHDGQLIAGLVLRAVADVRAIVRGVEHAGVSLASGIKMMLAKPVKH